MIDSISPFRQGQTYPPATWYLQDTEGNTLILPTGTAFTLYIYHPQTNQTVTGAGTWDTSNLANGIVVYQWNAADSAQPGTYFIYLGFVTPTGQQGYTKPVQWVIDPLLYQQ
jgi:hypothetical protein